MRPLGTASTAPKETHNGLWTSTTLQRLGIEIEPQDPLVAQAVEAYYSAFIDNARALPGTADVLAALEPRYRLGLLSNLTHGRNGWGRVKTVSNPWLASESV